MLTGYRGSGKTTQLKLLCDILNEKGVDTDKLIEEKVGSSIHEIFDICGEETFRELESDIISNLPEDAIIISTGGGTLINPENVLHLRKNSLIVYLEADTATLAARIKGSVRPSLTGSPIEEEVESVLSERIQAYRSAADICINASRKPEEIAKEIVDFYNKGYGDPIWREDTVNTLLHTGIPEIEKEELKGLIRSHDVFLYGILGNPCLQSLSPVVWKILFKKYGMPAHYTWFETDDPKHLLKWAKNSGIRGLSVTIPYKEKIIPLVSEVKHDAAVIGAINTVLILGGKTYGYNTDWKGVYKPLEGAEGKIAVIIGAGGAAAAAAYAVSMRGFQTYILNRHVSRAQELAARFGAFAGPIEMLDSLKPDLLVNATPVGMNGDQNLPVPASCLRKGMRVFDLVYTPVDTPLLKAALVKGCYVIPGTEMFIHQLVEQFRLLTGIEVSTYEIREMLS